MDNNYKRQYRQLDDTTKQKISQSLRNCLKLELKKCYRA